MVQVQIAHSITFKKLKGGRTITGEVVGFRKHKKTGKMYVKIKSEDGVYFKQIPESQSEKFKIND